MNLEQRSTPHQSERGTIQPTLIVIHGDAGKSDAGTVAWLKDPASKVSYHYLIGRDGTVYQFVPEAKKAWHAGLSKWKGMEVGNTVNPVSIGVAFANDGTGKENFKQAQYKAGAELLKAICKRHGLGWDDIVTHAQVSPGRKKDPWDWFDMASLKKLFEAA